MFVWSETGCPPWHVTNSKKGPALLRQMLIFFGSLFSVCHCCNQSFIGSSVCHCCNQCSQAEVPNQAVTMTWEWILACCSSGRVKVAGARLPVLIPRWARLYMASSKAEALSMCGLQQCFGLRTFEALSGAAIGFVFDCIQDCFAKKRRSVMPWWAKKMG